MLLVPTQCICAYASVYRKVNASGVSRYGTNGSHRTRSARGVSYCHRRSSREFSVCGDQLCADVTRSAYGLPDGEWGVAAALRRQLVARRLQSFSGLSTRRRPRASRDPLASHWRHQRSDPSRRDLRHVNRRHSDHLWRGCSPDGYRPGCIHRSKGIAKNYSCVITANRTSSPKRPPSVHASRAAQDSSCHSRSRT